MPKLFHNNVAICYETFGNPKDPCIIFIMGIGGQLIRWPQEIITGLVQEGFFVVTFDNRDVGFSSYYDHLFTPALSAAINAKEHNQVLSIPYSLEDMAADVITLMDGLYIEKAYIAGISMGGMIAQLVAINFPQRVLGLICIATTSGDPYLPPATPEVLELFTKPREILSNRESYINRMMEIHQLYNAVGTFNKEKMRDAFQKDYERAYHPQGFQRQLLAIIFSEPRTEKLKQVIVPSLIIHGDCDPAFPIEHGQHLARSLPNSHLEIIQKMGHGLPEFMHAKLIELIANYFR